MLENFLFCDAASDDDAALERPRTGSAMTEDKREPRDESGIFLAERSLFGFQFQSAPPSRARII